MAALPTLVGAFLGTTVATTVGSGIIDPPDGTQELLVVFAALVGAIIWNLITWYFGMPSSSSHALLGGLVGAALAASQTVQWNGVLDKVIIPMIVSPIVGFALAGLLWTFRRANQHKAMRGFRRAKIVSAAAMALGHGLQDAQKTTGVIVLALVIGGYQSGFDVPWWVILLAAGALSAGTYAGGWRIMRTLGRRIIDLDPPRGFAAEVTAAGVLYTTAFVFAAPISTTQSHHLVGPRRGARRSGDRPCGGGWRTTLRRRGGVPDAERDPHLIRRLGWWHNAEHVQHQETGR